MTTNVEDDEDTARRAEEAVALLVKAFEAVAEQGDVKVKHEKTQLFYCAYVLRVTPDEHTASHVVNRTGTEILLPVETAS